MENNIRFILYGKVVNRNGHSHAKFSTLYKHCVENKRDEFLTLEKYVSDRVDVEYSDAYPYGAENWCVSTLLVAIKSAGNNRVKQKVDALWSR